MGDVGLPREPTRIRLLREQDSLTLSRLGAETGIDPQLLSDYERGNRPLPDHHALALADYFEVPVDYLMRDGNGRRLWAVS